MEMCAGQAAVMMVLAAVVLRSILVGPSTICLTFRN